MCKIIFTFCRSKQSRIKGHQGKTRPNLCSLMRPAGGKMRGKAVACVQEGELKVMSCDMRQVHMSIAQSMINNQGSVLYFHWSEIDTIHFCYFFFFNFHVFSFSFCTVRKAIMYLLTYRNRFSVQSRESGFFWPYFWHWLGLPLNVHVSEVPKESQ